NGSVRKIESDSSIPNLEIILTKTKFNIQGIVTDGVKALPKILITIHDEDINKITSVTSDENGYYEFVNIEGDKEVFISVNDPKYKRLKTDLFRLDKNISNFNLILEEK
ncbi:carboxypeptidase-like regulatory domain-containing protein, partial [uncultured Fusobacterium sp.]